MKILMLAPEPFFQPRGTPISIFFRIKVLSNLGHEIDLITYHIGENKKFENLKILRIPNLFFINKIKIGPSSAKIPLDFLLILKAVWQLTQKKYDMIFSHEEAALFGVTLAKIWRLPHIYDMHSSLPQQLENFNFSRSKLLKKIFMWMEKYILKNSNAIIVICLDLLKKVRAEGFGKKSILLENFIDFEHPKYSQYEIKKKRQEYASEEEKIVLYAGNFQPYQGISLLLKAAAKLRDESVVFLLVGENKTAVERMKKKAEELNISEKVHFTGQVPPFVMPLFISLADVLVSPRLSGTNTPLKIYSFLKSGKPLVATNLWTHTQILSNKISILVNPDPESMAEGISFALFNEKAKERAYTAKKMAERNYTYSKYRGKIITTIETASGLEKSCV